MTIRVRFLAFAIVSVTSLASFFGCKSGTTCSSWAGDSTGASWGQCSDNSKRAVECRRTAPGKYACDCKKDDTVVKKFERSDHVLGDKASSIQVANEACGWDLAL